VLQIASKKIKVLLFNQQSFFKPNMFWLNFVLNAFDFALMKGPSLVLVIE